MVDDSAILTPTAPEPSRVRRFGISDLMASIGWIAVILASGRHDFQRLSEQFVQLCRSIAAYLGWVSLGPWGTRQGLLETMANQWSSVVWYGLQASELVVLVTTPVFLFMRLRRPRPSFRGLVRQPGTIAGLSIALGFVLVVGWLHRLVLGLNTRLATPIAVGCTVAVAWAILALSRNWEVERSWIDRLGRILGVVAIVVSLISSVKYGI